MTIIVKFMTRDSGALVFKFFSFWAYKSNYLFVYTLPPSVLKLLHWNVFPLFFNSATSTSFIPDATEKKRQESSIYWFLIGTISGVFIFACFAFVCFLFITHRKGKVVTLF